MLSALVAMVALFSVVAALGFAGAVLLALDLAPEAPLARVVDDRVTLLDAGRALTGALFCVLVLRRHLRAALAVLILLTLATLTQELLLRAYDTQTQIRLVLHLGGIALLWGLIRRARLP